MNQINNWLAREDVRAAMDQVVSETQADIESHFPPVVPWNNKRMRLHFKLVRERNKKLVAQGKPIPQSKIERPTTRRERREQARRWNKVGYGANFVSVPSE